MGGLDVDDVLTGVDAVVAAGLADPDRLVLTEAATVGSWPHGSLPAISVSRRRYRSPRDRLVVRTVRQQPRRVGRRFPRRAAARCAEEYSGRSPVLHAANVTTPVLLTSGRHDRATPVGQAVEFYRALRERGVPAEWCCTRRRGTAWASSPRSSIWPLARSPGSSGSYQARATDASCLQTTRDELEALPTKDLYDRTIALAKRRLDVGFFWDLLKVLPVAEEVIGDDERARPMSAVLWHC